MDLPYRPSAKPTLLLIEKGSLIWSTLPYRSLIRGAPHFFGDQAMRLSVYTSFRPAPGDP